MYATGRVPRCLLFECNVFSVLTCFLILSAVSFSAEHPVIAFSLWNRRSPCHITPFSLHAPCRGCVLSCLPSSYMHMCVSLSPPPIRRLTLSLCRSCAHRGVGFPSRRSRHHLRNVVCCVSTPPCIYLGYVCCVDDRNAHLPLSDPH